MSGSITKQLHPNLAAGITLTLGKTKHKAPSIDLMHILLKIGSACAAPWFFALAADASPWRVRQNNDKPWFDEPPTEMPQLRLPTGANNLAAGKPVSSSDRNPIIGRLEQLTDGDRGSLFDDEGHYVEIRDGKEWIQVDLGADAVINAVWLWYRHPIEAYDVPNDVIVQIWSTSNFPHNGSTVFNSDSDNTLGLGAGHDRPFATSRFGKLIRLEGLNGRYVRIWGNGSYRQSNKFVEVEVYGIPAEELKIAKSGRNGRFLRWYFVPGTVVILTGGLVWWIRRRLQFHGGRSDCMRQPLSMQSDAQQVVDGKPPSAPQPPR